MNRGAAVVVPVEAREDATSVPPRPAVAPRRRPTGATARRKSRRAQRDYADKMLRPSSYEDKGGAA